MSDTNKSHHHILPLSVYMAVGSALIVLTVVTVWAAQQDFGAYNLLIAMIIASVKASLVALYFMHLRYDNKIYATVFVASITFLAIFIIFILFDTLRRDDIYDIKSGPIESNASIYDLDTLPDSLSNSTDSLAIDSTTAKAEEQSGH